MMAKSLRTIAIGTVGALVLAGLGTGIARMHGHGKASEQVTTEETAPPLAPSPSDAGAGGREYDRSDLTLTQG